ncbi:hypothetical protein AKJ09_06772 [Labilithrix luteola]|uniref:Uncharacterized protein n=1 Tax=Labilithrix luteola TaxID=1391654 RepID=A0A0K1Q2W0_9BACT|nr:hypothetical protein AKJ09_06772 [Labilithrix luteola]
MSNMHGPNASGLAIEILGMLGRNDSRHVVLATELDARKQSGCNKQTSHWRTLA